MHFLLMFNLIHEKKTHLADVGGRTQEVVIRSLESFLWGEQKQDVGDRKFFRPPVTGPRESIRVNQGLLKMAKEPQVVHSFPKNPLEEVRSSITYFKGKQYVDLRVYYKGDDGEFHPSKKGLTISVDLFPELEIGFQKLKEALDEQ